MKASPLRSGCIILLLPVLTTAFSIISRTNARRLPLKLFADQGHASRSLDRRELLLSAVTATFPLLPLPVHGRGLVQFPVDDPGDLLNSYHFLRVGDTLLEREDIWSTNPLFLTDREGALTPTGREQIQAASARLEAAHRTPGVIKYSLAASSIDAANLVGETLNVGRERIVPEFTYLDPRAIGQWDMLSYRTTQSAVWAMDSLEAGPNGSGGRPPPKDDGTPNETLADQAVRLVQVMSILETLYSGETILIIFPDGTGPALLSAMIAGIPLNRAHELEFGPGELRMDVTKASILQFLNDRDKAAILAYEQALAVGREELARLRSTKDIVSLMDQKMEAERIAIDNQYNEKEAKRLEREDLARESREEMARQKKLERQQQGQSTTGLDEQSTSPLFGVGAAAVIGTAGVFASSGTNRQEEKSAEKQGDQPATTNEVTTPFRTVGVLAESSFEDVEETSPAEAIDPYEAAEKAMQEYLDKDDGGEDWLTVLTQIAQDADDLEEMSDQQQ